MQKVRFQISVSADGFMAGPNQSIDEPLGEGGEALHQWYFNLREGETSPSSRVIEETQAGYGAVVMGRNMFGGGRGAWPDEEWRGWWGENPPYHAPVFVVTHYEREPLTMEGGTTFNFVTGGPDEALRLAREAAGDLDISIAGGAQIARHFLTTGEVDEFWLSISPVMLGAGEPLLTGLDPNLRLEQIDSIAGPDAVHVKYRAKL